MRLFLTTIAPLRRELKCGRQSMARKLDMLRGTAGSGKTTVALHRIAYLAYDDPEIDSKRTLFVVFSPGLRNYVSHVLPALGVARVGIRTWHEWASEQRVRHFPKLPRTPRDDAPAVVQRFGASHSEAIQSVHSVASLTS